MYGRDKCRACHRVSAILESEGIDFIYVNTSEDQKAYDYIVEVLGAKAVPVIEAPGWHKPILGYQPDELTAFIEWWKETDF